MYLPTDGGWNFLYRDGMVLLSKGGNCISFLPGYYKIEDVHIIYNDHKQ